MTNATDALRALDPSYWEVEVRVSGESVLTIGSDHLAGISNIEDYADTVRKCGEHLRSFIGTPAGSASGEDGDGLANCAECGAFLEHVRPGKHQHPTCSHVASALQAEVARLRELLRRAQPCVRHTAGNVAQRLGMDYAKSDYELLAAIDAAMGACPNG